jgi:hypothetical protein
MPTRRARRHRANRENDARCAQSGRLLKKPLQRQMPSGKCCRAVVGEGAAQRERGNPGGTVAKRGRPGAPEAGTWVTMAAGWTVTRRRPRGR